jgi:hypothetical protein
MIYSRHEKIGLSKKVEGGKERREGKTHLVDLRMPQYPHDRVFGHLDFPNLSQAFRLEDYHLTLPFDRTLDGVFTSSGTLYNARLPSRDTGEDVFAGGRVDDVRFLIEGGEVGGDGERGFQRTRVPDCELVGQYGGSRDREDESGGGMTREREQGNSRK